MVKGITRQVIVVKGSADTSFEQAIFLVRDDILSKGGVTEDALLKEARQACKNAVRPHYFRSIFWSVFGAAFISLIWLLTTFL